MSVTIPKNYSSVLNFIETQEAIKFVKDTFERKIAEYLNLTRVSAPLFVRESSGLNDHLSGVEKPVSFQISAFDDKIEIVQSLAKWKRMALKEYRFLPDTGLYTDMNAIRKDETLDNLHSLYVDQWDWERVILPDNRNISYLGQIVRKIVKAIVDTKTLLNKQFNQLTQTINEDVFFITTEELLQRYPHLSSKERENAICREKQTVFIMGIGDQLSNGSPHDLRAPDYDDWRLNGDILVWYEPLGQAVELSSMGIRVDSASLQYQLTTTNTLKRLKFPFHREVMEGKLPLSIGGGIGQSRLCLVMLEKVHIGEVQASLWPEEDLKVLKDHGIMIL
ncbi:MAG: aspartate--ammonia ligase [Bacilli bacterium]|jgi:aspartate--ammonia ligase|nr:aspartate--ammonia ligase [Bacilli bacterium]HHU24185.1 aspartate--ammonia ligase [Acholeplasmataceae bacterium]